MNRLSKKAALAFATGLSLVTPPAHASGIGQAKADLSSLPSPSTLPSIAVAAKHRLAGSGRGGLATAYTLSGGEAMKVYNNFGSSGKAINRLGLPAADVASRAIGEIRTSLRRIELPGFGGRAPRLIPVSSGRLNALMDFCRSIETESVPHENARALTLDELKNGVALPDGFVFRFIRTNHYALFDRNTGRGYVVFDDPHVGRDLNNPGATHYSDWSAASLVTVLPKASTNERVFTFARSTGGDAKNGFGLPTDIYIITDRIAIQVHGLNTASPTGSVSHDPMFVYEALAPEIAATPVLFWDPTVGELRTASGDRSAPPAGAREYGRVEPEAFKDNDNGLQNGSFRFEVAEEPGLQRNELEFREAFRQGLSALTNPMDGVRNAGRTHVEGAKPVARENYAYGQKFADVVAKLKTIQVRLEEIAEKVLSDGISLAEVESLKGEAENLRADELKYGSQLRQIQDRTPRPLK
jgi:hypothetical protein